MRVRQPEEPMVKTSRRRAVAFGQLNSGNPRYTFTNLFLSMPMHFWYLAFPAEAKIPQRAVDHSVDQGGFPLVRAVSIIRTISAAFYNFWVIIDVCYSRRIGLQRGCDGG